MFPFIRSGDWLDVAVGDGDVTDIACGDVILCKRDELLHVHRVIGMRDGCPVTKGDWSFGSDGRIEREDVLGRVVAVQRGARSVDLRSRRSRFISQNVARTTFLLQYLALMCRMISRISGRLLQRAQGLRLYRAAAKALAGRALVAVREAGDGDIEAMRDLFIMGGHDVKKDIIAIKKEGFWLVAERRGRIVAALTVTRFEKDPALWVIFGLEVKPVFRGLGIGRRLVSEAVRKATEGGAKTIGLFVNKQNKAALELYQSLGFTISDSFPPDFNRVSFEFWLSRGT